VIKQDRLSEFELARLETSSPLANTRAAGLPRFKPHLPDSASAEMHAWQRNGPSHICEVHPEKNDSKLLLGPRLLRKQQSECFVPHDCKTSEVTFDTNKSFIEVKPAVIVLF
jgi:hypothetical protein